MQSVCLTRLSSAHRVSHSATAGQASLSASDSESHFKLSARRGFVETWRTPRDTRKNLQTAADGSNFRKTNGPADDSLCRNQLIAFMAVGRHFHPNPLTLRHRKSSMNFPVFSRRLLCASFLNSPTGRPSVRVSVRCLAAAAVRFSRLRPVAALQEAQRCADHWLRFPQVSRELWFARFLVRISQKGRGNPPRLALHSSSLTDWWKAAPPLRVRRFHGETLRRCSFRHSTRSLEVQGMKRVVPP